MGSVLQHDCAYESYESVDDDVSDGTESGVLTAYYGGFQDAELCVDWHWDVLGELCVVFDGEEEGGEAGGKVTMIFL